jgi:hypothetical protein
MPRFKISLGKRPVERLVGYRLRITTVGHANPGGTAALHDAASYSCFVAWLPTGLSTCDVHVLGSSQQPALALVLTSASMHRTQPRLAERVYRALANS